MVRLFSGIWVLQGHIVCGTHMAHPCCPTALLLCHTPVTTLANPQQSLNNPNQQGLTTINSQTLMPTAALSNFFFKSPQHKLPSPQTSSLDVQERTRPVACWTFEEAALAVPCCMGRAALPGMTRQSLMLMCCVSCISCPCCPLGSTTLTAGIASPSCTACSLR